MQKAFLLINGNPPENLPSLKKYGKIYCTDGAYAHLIENHVLPDVVVGDFDSFPVGSISKEVKVIENLDQDYTDFYKCLEVIKQAGYDMVDVYGSTGTEHDHFLGNLTTALMFKEKLQLTFYDDYSKFFFSEKHAKLQNVKNRIISLYPFPKATGVQSKGLFYPLNGMNLDMTSKIGTRNHAIKDEVEITYEEGELLLFISQYTLSREEISYKNKIN
ncbi:thiamine diphosphokinase [Flavobacteriaceae bacterium Ap0902]|nr:thiamine diphosphokinase [Flavobacteriaceae bacterium Ap0902]